MIVNAYCFIGKLFKARRVGNEVKKIIENGLPVKINKHGEKGNYPLEHLDNTPYYHYV